MAEDRNESDVQENGSDDRQLLDDLTVLNQPIAAGIQAAEARQGLDEDRGGGLNELATIHQGTPIISDRVVPLAQDTGAALQSDTPVQSDSANPTQAQDAIENARPSDPEMWTREEPLEFQSELQPQAAPAAPAPSAAPDEALPPQPAVELPAAAQSTARNAAVQTDDVTVQTTAEQTTTTTTTPPETPLPIEGDGVTFTPAPVVGNEDNALPLNLSFNLIDARDQLGTVVIEGVPDGFTLNHGSRAEDGSWVLQPDDIAGLTISAPENYSGSLQLQVSATSVEGGNISGTTTMPLDVTFIAVADAPDVAANPARGAEDTYSSLNLSAALTDTDGSESLTSFVIEGVPAGTSFAVSDGHGGVVTVGTDLGNGTWSFDGPVFGQLLLRGPADSDQDMDLTVKVTSTEASNGSAATTTIAVHVTIDPVTDQPSITFQNAHGTEDSRIDLSSLSAGWGDSLDGSEVHTVTISGIPDGATLRLGDTVIAVTGGTATLSADQVAGISATNKLTVQPPADSDVDFSLTATAHAVDGTSPELTSSATITVVVDPVSDTPVLVVTGARGNEDSRVDLSSSISVQWGDAIDGSEAHTITISGIPTGATLRLGDTELTATGGTVTLSSDQLSSISASNKLTIQPPADSDVDFNLNVTATAVDGTAAGASVTKVLSVTVDPVTDQPTLTIADHVTGNEDTRIDLSSLGVQWGDYLDGSEVHTVTISGVPSGATLRLGSTTITVTNGTATLTAAQVSSISGSNKLTIQPPTNSDADFSLTATAHAVDGTSPELTSSASISVTVNPVTDLAVKGTGSTWNQTTQEDHSISVTPQFKLGDTDGSEHLTGIQIVVSNADKADGSWSYNGTELTWTQQSDGSWVATLPMSAATGSDTTSWTLSGVTFNPTHNSSNDVSYTLKVTTQDGTAAPATASLTGTVKVTPLVDTPDMVAGNAVGNEDSYVHLNLGAAVTDTNSEAITSYALENVPSQFSFYTLDSNGHYVAAGSHNGTTWTFSAAEIGNLYVKAIQDWSGDAVSLTLKVGVTDTDENTASLTDSRTFTKDFTVTINPVSDAPDLVVRDAWGNEDTVIPLHIRATETDVDGSETLSLTISNVPTGAKFYQNGVEVGTNNGDGTWSFDHSVLDAIAAGQTLGIQPPHDSNVDFSLSLALASQDGSAAPAITTGTIDVTVHGVADQPANLPNTLTASGVEDTNHNLVNLGLGQLHLSDTDGSESLSVVIYGIPDGMRLSMDAGYETSLVYAGNGKWRVDADALEHVNVLTPTNYGGAFTLKTDIVVTENDGNSRVDSRDLVVDVARVSDPASISVSASGVEDQVGGVPLNIALGITDTTTGAETITSVTLTGLGAKGLSLTGPAGSFTYDADSDTYTLTSTSGLHVTGFAEDWAGTVSGLTLSVTTQDGTSAPLTTTQAFSVTVDPVADVAMSGASSHVGYAGSLADIDATSNMGIHLNIAASSQDNDGSESIDYVISGVPEGAVIQGAVNLYNGSWYVPGGNVDSLVLNVPGQAASSVGGLTLTVTPVVHDGSSTNSSVSDTFTVTWPTSGGGGGGAPVTVPVAADVVITPSLAKGNEDTAIALNLNIATAGPEDGLVADDVSVLLYLPQDYKVNGAIWVGGDTNAWLVPTSSLSSVSITPPENFSGHISVDYKVVTTETESGDWKLSGPFTQTVEVVAVTDDFGLSAGGAGKEDTAIALNLSLTLGDTDGSEAVLGAILISGVPSGASLSAGTKNADGTWSVASADLGGLTLTPPTNWAGTLHLSAQASVQDGTEGAVITKTVSFNVAVDAVADAPNLSVAAVSGTSEDHAVALNIAASLNDTDGSEVLSVVVSGLPEGSTLSNGTNNGDGTWTLKTSELSGLKFVPPTNWSGPVDLTITAYSTETSNVDQASSIPVPVHFDVTPQADASYVDPLNATTTEDIGVQLFLNARAEVTGDAATGVTAEVLTVTLGSVPTGSTFTDHNGNAIGTDLGNGQWKFTSAEVSDLWFAPPDNAKGEFTLTATSTTTDGTSIAHGTTESFTVSVAAQTDGVVFGAATPVSAHEDQAAALPFTLTQLDGSEHITSIVVSSTMDGFTLNHGTHNSDGTWTVTADQLSGLTWQAAGNDSGDGTISIAVTSQDGSAAPVTNVQTVGVHVEAVADTPTLSAHDVSGTWGLPIALDLSAATPDSSESLSVTIAGMPSDATLSAGTHNDDGTWTLTQDQLTGLTLTTKEGDGSDFTLTVTATSTEDSNGDQASLTSHFGVTVNAPTAINGTSGDDLLTGTLIGDTINGGAGNDTIYGGAGNDVIHPGSGNNVVYGGEGDDLFAFTHSDFANHTGSDTLADFVYGQGGNDTVDLSGVGMSFELYVNGVPQDIPHDTHSFDISAGVSAEIRVLDGSTDGAVIHLDGIEKVTF